MHRAATKAMITSNSKTSSSASASGQSVWTQSEASTAYDRASKTLAKCFALLLTQTAGIKGRLVGPLSQDLTQAALGAAYGLLGDFQVWNLNRDAAERSTAAALVGPRTIDVYAHPNEQRVLSELYGNFEFQIPVEPMPPRVVRMYRNYSRTDDTQLIDALYDRYVRITSEPNSETTSSSEALNPTTMKTNQSSPNGQDDEAKDAAVNPQVPTPAPKIKEPRSRTKTKSKAHGAHVKKADTKKSPPADKERPGYKRALAEVHRVFGAMLPVSHQRTLCADWEENAQDVILVCDGPRICAFVPMESMRGTLLCLQQNGFRVTGASPANDVLHLEYRFDNEANALEAFEELATFPLTPAVRTQVPQP